MPLDDIAHELEGPILVVGAGGFVGANLFHQILNSRSDVYGTMRKSNSWRMEGVPSENIFELDTNNQSQIREMIKRLMPRTIFYLVSHGAYSFQNDSTNIFTTNLVSLVSFTGIVEELYEGALPKLIHAGSSSEYGLNSVKPTETAIKNPDSAYSVSKNAASLWLEYLGRAKQFPCANLRLYSVYGPYEDSSRLIPQLVFNGIDNGYPPLVNPEVSRDFVFVLDAVQAFIKAAINLKFETYGQSFNIGSGTQSSIRDIALTSQNFFGLDDAPDFATMESRSWDREEWSSNPKRAKSVLKWEASTNLEAGFAQTVDWWENKLVNSDPGKLTVKARDSENISAPIDSICEQRRKITAIIACYMDGRAIPIMYERLASVISGLGFDYEIIFVNDCSPDDSQNVILEVTRNDLNVIGINHSRNFGSQNAFLSGMEIATGDSIVLLDGDLQDPPEVIPEFVEQWNAGYDVVYGHRIQREMKRGWEPLYKLFYILFDLMSNFSIPRNAGDFSLIDRKVVDAMLRFEERDVFLRGLRAYAGFKQTGVDYKRPERMFGTSTNNFWKNIGWAKKGIFSFSSLPLKIMTAVSVILVAAFSIFFFIAIGVRIFAPELVPAGLTTIILLIIGFGSINLLSTAVVGEYIAKIIEETKGRPRFIRDSITLGGQTQIIHTHSAESTLDDIKQLQERVKNSQLPQTDLKIQ